MGTCHTAFCPANRADGLVALLLAVRRSSAAGASQMLASQLICFIGYKGRLCRQLLCACLRAKPYANAACGQAVPASVPLAASRTGLITPARLLGAPAHCRPYSDTIRDFNRRIVLAFSRCTRVGFLSAPQRPSPAMVLTRAQGRLEYTQYALLNELLAGNTARARLLLEQGEAAALHVGPSNFTTLHAAALSDSHRWATACRRRRRYSPVLRCVPAQPMSTPSCLTHLPSCAAPFPTRLVAPLVAAGAAPNEQIAHLDGAGALSLRRFLVDHSRLPSSKLCAVFRGARGPAGGSCWI